MAYTNPPVHEVILDVRFSDDANLLELQTVSANLQGMFGFSKITEQVQLNHSFTVGSSPINNSVTKKTDGFIVATEDDSASISVLTRQLTMHLVRSKGWPSGEYIGWSNISERFGRVREYCAAAYSDLNLERVGLRYLNRIAIPVDLSLIHI